MAPSPPLPVTEDTPPDMLAGSMDLRVVLPNNHSVKMSVERSTPMMDLLVQVTTANKISPGGHVIQAVGDKCILPYKPSTPIGALDTWTIQIVPKTKAFGNLPFKKAPLKPNNQQPFEQTFRLQVHLPRNQLFVTRVGSKTLLSDILYLACNEKNLDTSKYELRHPANLEERLQLSCTLADYKLQEVVMVAKSRPMGAALSSADIMALHKEEEKRRQQAKAGGTRFFGAVFKRNRSTMGEGSVSSDSLGGRSISPARSDESASRSASPPTPNLPPMIVQPPPRPQRKRRPAPKPPTPNNMEQAVDKQSCSQGNTKDSLKLSHSRNSSDSSGYHEASVLSESPDTHSTTIQGSAETLPRRSKLPSAHPLPNGQPSQGSHLSRSLSNLTAMSGGHVRSLHSASTSALSTAGQGMKKKKAAPPPPKVRVIPDLQEEPGHGDRCSTLPTKARRSRQERGLGNTASLENVSSFSQAKSPSLGSSSSSSSVTCNGDDHLEEIVEDVANVTSDASSVVSVGHLGSRPCSGSDVDAAVTSNHSSLNGSCKPSSSSDISVTANFQIINSGRKHSSANDVDGGVNTSRKHSNSSSVVETVTSTHPSINGSRKHYNSNDEDTGLIMSRKYSNSSNVDTPVISSNAGINISRQHSSSSEADVKISSNIDTQVTSTNVGLSISPKHSSSNDVDACVNIGRNPTSSSNVDAEVTSNNAIVSIGRKHTDSSTVVAAVTTIKAGVNSSGKVTSHTTINMMADVSSVERPELEDKDEVDRAFQSVTDELEAAIIADEIKQSKKELRTNFNPVILPPLDLAPTSPFPSHSQDYICPGIDDWQYQLPAPPSAFRDANSPIPTEGGTIVLAETKVFQESTPSEDLSFVNEQSKMNEDYDSLPHRNKPSKVESNISKNEVERVNPIFDPEQFEDVVQTKVSTERYVQNHSKDSAQPQSKAKINSWPSTNNDIDSIPNEVDTRRNSDTKTSALPSESNSLNRYFTISAYQKPNDVDHIFDESSSDDNSTSGKASAAKSYVEFKKPYSVQRPSKKYGSTSSLVATNVARTNSFNSNANPSGFTPVKRSTSYVSLVHSSRQTKPSHGIPYSARTTSVGNLALEAEESSRVAAGLGKAYSQQNITKGIANGDEERSEFQYSPRVLEDPPHHALQSLQVMRSILPQLKQTQTPVAINNEKPALPDNSQVENPTHRSSTLPRSVRSGSVDTISSQQAMEPNSEERRYSYRGPPAINLTTWTERPKIQVSIKNDRDYRTNCKQPEPQAKATAEPLTMRIVTLTTATGYKRSTSQEEPKTTVSFTKPVADVAKVSDPSRVPIVRAVELKKPFQAQKSSENNGSFLRNGEGTDQADSRFAGVNSLAQRFSLGGVVRAKTGLNSRPVSAYDYVRNVENTESSRTAAASVKSTSTNNFNGPNAHWNSLSRTNSNSNGTGKYTSIVGINNSSSNSWDAPRQTGSSFVKVNGFGGTRQHMPVVKGFQFTSSTPNTSSVSVKVQSPSVEIVSSSKSKALPSLCTRKQDSAMPAVVKVEHSPAIVKVERPVGKPSTVTIRSSGPPPPPPAAPFLSGIVLKKSTLPRGKLLPPPEANPRDQLMDAIRKFGTQGNLKQVGIQSATTNVILKI